MTDQIKRKLQEEINTLEHELIHELPKEIKKAAALGDLSENAEYHMAKQRQEFVKARVRQLGKRLAELSMINMNNIPRDRIGLGSTVKVFDNARKIRCRHSERSRFPQWGVILSGTAFQAQRRISAASDPCVRRAPRRLQ